MEFPAILEKLQKPEKNYGVSSIRNYSETKQETPRLDLMDIMQQTQRLTIPTVAIFVAIAFSGTALALWFTADSSPDRSAFEGEDNQNMVRHFAISHDLKLLATISSELLRHDILVRDNATRHPLHRLRFHDLRPDAVDFHPHARLLLALYEDGTVVIWDFNEDTPKPTVFGHLNDKGCHAVFSKDGSMIAAAGLSGQIAVWNFASRARIQTFSFRGRAYTLEFGSQGETLMAAGIEGGVCFWEIASGRERHFPGSDRYRCRSAAFSADGTKILSGNLEGSLRLWNVADGSLAWSHQRENTSFTSVRFTRDGKSAIAGTVKGQVILISFRSHQRFETVCEMPSSISQATFTHDGRLQLSSFSSDVISRTWRTPSEDADDSRTVTTTNNL